MANGLAIQKKVKTRRLGEVYQTQIAHSDGDCFGCIKVSSFWVGVSDAICVRIEVTCILFLNPGCFLVTALWVALNA